jgi:hypothetical protein
MKYAKKNNVQLVRSAAAIFWMGFFMAISFMEAQIKFTAPGISMAQGLQIGKVVFGMLNICEWIFLAGIVVTCFVKKPAKPEGWLITGLALILTLETFWLLPALDADAGRIIQGQTITGHSLHWCYVALELIKAPMLLFAAITGVRSLLKSGPVPAISDLITTL